MGISKSYLNYINVPSAWLTDGLVLHVPLYAVTTMTLSESYHLPPIGSSGAKAIVATHDDTITMNAMLVGGVERFAWKLALETMADASKRGGGLGAIGPLQGKISGLILITSMTIRWDLQIQSLSFTASASKRDVLDVSLTLAHMPRPGAIGKLVDLASIGIGALADFGGN